MDDLKAIAVTAFVRRAMVERNRGDNNRLRKLRRSIEFSLPESANIRRVHFERPLS